MPAAASMPIAMASGHSPCARVAPAAFAESGLAAMGDAPRECPCPLWETGSGVSLPRVAGSERANNASMTIETMTDTIRSCVAAGVCIAEVSEGTARMNTARVNIRPRVRLSSAANR